MCGKRLNLVIATAFLAALPLFALADTDNEDLEWNRSQFEKWKADPEHYARLRHDLQTFLAMPVERQAQLRELDRVLHEEDSSTYARLRRTMERYNDWLRGLPQGARQKIENVPNAQGKLALIKQMRELEWVDRLPKALREELGKLPADKQPARIAELRKEERAREAEWRFAIRHWEDVTQKRPQMARLKDFPEPVQVFVRDSLYPMLSKAEKDRLDRAEGKWPLYPQTLVELADKHPIELPGPTTGPSRLSDMRKDLPPKLLRILEILQTQQIPPAKQLAQADGKWPDYARVVTRIASNRKITLAHQLGPCKPSEFSVAVQQFMQNRLLPALSQEEKQELKDSEGHWPLYPKTLRDLARKHLLQVPGMGLPGPRANWDKYRVQPTASSEALPDVPDHTLTDFMQKDLTPEERSSLPSLSLADPVSREQILQAYFRRNPAALLRIMQADQKKRLANAKGRP